MKKLAFIIILTACFGMINLPIANSEVEFPEMVQTYIPDFLKEDATWVDSVMSTMSLDERIAQLIMIPIYSNKNTKYNNEVVELVKKYQIGGIICMQGGPARQVNLVNRLQTQSKIPMLVGMDAEWSLGMRLDSVITYPKQMMIGAISDNEIIYQMGAEFARQLKRVGVNVSFSPDIDINNNANNPVINDRSFGENKYNVAEKGYAYAKGLQDNGVMAVGKHFPGHGDTNVDSHKSMPVINHSRERLDSIEFYPFKYLTERGVASMMISHLFVPAIDTTQGLPATLSPIAIKQVLRKDIGFNGLIFSDAMNMGGIVNYFKGNEADVKALIAGIDMIMFPTDVKDVIEKIKESIVSGEISENDINDKCRRILMSKKWLGLDKGVEEISTQNIYDDLNNVSARLIQQRLIENAITLISNKDDIIPINKIAKNKIASISFGYDKNTTFQNRLSYYAKVDNLVYNKDLKGLSDEKLNEKLNEYDVIIVSIHGKNQRLPSKKFGVPQDAIDAIDVILNLDKKVIVDIFANPYSLAYFNNLDKADAVIVSYNDLKLTNDFSAQLIFGGIPAKGILPVSPTDNIKEGTGINTEKIRLKYSDIPEDAGVSSEVIHAVDSIFGSGIRNKAYPGGQVVLLRKGEIFYQKSLGFHTYDNTDSVKDLDIYDLASLTKVIATTSDIIKLYDDNKFEITDKVSEYYHEWKHSNKAEITFEQLLTHRAGLEAWIPFYKHAEEHRTKIYSKEKSDEFPYVVADSMYINKDYHKTIFNEIRQSQLKTPGKYVYSDLGFIILPYVIKELSGKDYVNYTYENIFEPLGAYSLCFNPLDKYSKEEIVPTENDTYFRGQQLHGHVHDQATAMLGGVSGHAGLFGNANDLAKIMEIYLENGQYAGKRYFSEEAVKKFTEYHYDPSICRRALCWDKPLKNDRTKGLGTKSASAEAFGHTGYTGTMVWCDPKYDMAMIFLSNRVYTDSENWKLTNLNIRTNIEEAFYKAILDFESKRTSN